MFRANLFSRTVASRIESRGYMCHRQRVFGMVSTSLMSKHRVSGSVLRTCMMFARAHRPVFTRVLVASSMLVVGLQLILHIPQSSSSLKVSLCAMEDECYLFHLRAGLVITPWLRSRCASTPNVCAA